METTMECVTTIHKEIGILCASCLFYEVSTSPKPGLVDRINNGAHKDMNFFTFMRSIAAITPYFSKFAEIGCSLNKIDENTLGMIRPMGIECEESMFKATKGVNTHKGSIFSLGILATAAGHCYSKFQDLSSERVCSVAAEIASPAYKDFSKQNYNSVLTKGEKIYKSYGISGVRGEAASGFRSVREYALPVMKELISCGCYSRNSIYLQVLLHLMAQVVDTNVISRGGLDAVEYVKSAAENALALGGAITPEGMDEIIRMDEEFIKHNISPGGCADLLSVTMMLYFLENLL